MQKRQNFKLVAQAALEGFEVKYERHTLFRREGAVRTLAFNPKVVGVVDGPLSAYATCGEGSARAQQY